MTMPIDNSHYMFNIFDWHIDVWLQNGIYYTSSNSFIHRVDWRHHWYENAPQLIEEYMMKHVFKQ